jgi:hypothetical protein
VEQISGEDESSGFLTFLDQFASSVTVEEGFLHKLNNIESLTVQWNNCNMSRALAVIKKLLEICPKLHTLHTQQPLVRKPYFKAVDSRFHSSINKSLKQEGEVLWSPDKGMPYTPSLDGMHFSWLVWCAKGGEVLTIKDADAGLGKDGDSESSLGDVR